MARTPYFNSPLFLGFDQLERVLDRIAKSSQDGYPPYNIERTGDDEIMLTLAVAGFTEEDLSVTIEDNQLVIRGKQEDAGDRTFLHRGIAARQFQRAFALAEGVDVLTAELNTGLLTIVLKEPTPHVSIKKIEIKSGPGQDVGKPIGFGGKKAAE